MVADALSLRVLVFRPASAATVDIGLRAEIAPSLVDRAEVVDGFVGRSGGDEDERVLATVWRSRPGEDDERALLRRSLPSEHAAIDDARLDEVGVEVAARFERPGPPGILRVFRGTVRAGELDAYIAAARAGMEADAAVNPGLIAFYLGRQGQDTFITVSAWTGWDAIEEATGGNIRRPFSTRNSERLVGWVVGHYEIVPDTFRGRGGTDVAAERLAS